MQTAQLTSQILHDLTINIACSEGESPHGQAKDEEQDLQLFYRANRCIFRHGKDLWMAHIDDLDPLIARSITLGLLMWLQEYICRKEIPLQSCILHDHEKVGKFGIPEA